MNQASFAGMESDVGGELDHWATPAGATLAILPLLPERVRVPGGILVEPAAGRGAILDAALPVLQPRTWSAYEIDALRCRDLQDKYPDHFGVFQRDFLEVELEPSCRAASGVLFLGNVPYSLATEFVEKCLRLADAPTEQSRKGVVAMLLQHDFATGVDRCERIHDKYRSSLYPLKRRPKFGNDGTGKRPFSWLVFDLAEPKSEWRPIG